MSNEVGSRNCAWHEPFVTGEEVRNWRAKVDEATAPESDTLDARRVMPSVEDLDEGLTDKGPDEMARELARREDPSAVPIEKEADEKTAEERSRDYLGAPTDVLMSHTDRVHQGGGGGNKRRLKRRRVFVACPKCDGSGRRSNVECRRCKGAGAVGTNQWEDCETEYMGAKPVGGGGGSNRSASSSSRSSSRTRGGRPNTKDPVLRKDPFDAAPYGVNDEFIRRCAANGVSYKMLLEVLSLHPWAYKGVVLAEAARALRDRDRPREAGEVGTSLKYGGQSGVKRQYYLRKSDIETLERCGVDMSRGRKADRKIDFTSALNWVCMLVQYECSLLRFENVRIAGITREQLTAVKESLSRPDGWWASWLRDRPA